MTTLTIPTVEDVTDPNRVQATSWDELEMVSMWPSRWPPIALQICTDAVAEAEPALRDEVANALPCEVCPESTRCLLAKRKEIGPLLFDRELMTRPRSSLSSLFPREQMALMFDTTQSLVASYRKPYGVEDRYVVGSSWDIAWSEKVGGDYLAKLTARLDRETGKIQFLDMNRWQRLSFPDQCATIEAEWARYRDDFVVIEEAGAQLVWRQHLAATSAVPVIGHGVSGASPARGGRASDSMNQDASKRDLRFGVPGLLIDVDQRRWVIPYQAGTRNFSEVEQFLSEAEAFGMNDGKLEGVGEHDDYVMAWWHLRWGFDRYRVKPARPGRAVPIADRGSEL